MQEIKNKAEMLVLMGEIIEAISNIFGAESINHPVYGGPRLDWWETVRARFKQFKEAEEADAGSSRQDT